MHGICTCSGKSYNAQWNLSVFICSWLYKPIVVTPSRLPVYTSFNTQISKDFLAYNTQPWLLRHLICVIWLRMKESNLL